MIYACGKCNFNVNSKSIWCDNCDKWYHLECTSLSNKIFIQLSKSDAKWYCTTCNTCKQCKKQIIGESICCDSCKNWYDIKCTKINKISDFTLFSETKKDWQCNTCTREVFPFNSLDNKIFRAILDVPKPYKTNKKIQELINKPNLPKLNFAEYEPSKYDFYSDIEKNTSLDIHSKYYDTNDFNEMTKDLNPKISVSLLHTNISTLTGNGGKLECTLKSLNFEFDIIAVTETWNCTTNNHLFTPVRLENYKQ